MIKEVNYTQYLTEMTEQLPKGAFVTTKYGDQINTMTIGWGSVGVFWGKPIFTVAVRYSRFTYELLEKSGEFTISVPLKTNLKDELAFCGTKSGRDYNKFEHLSLDAIEGQKVNVPVIGQCDLHYECKVVYQQAMEPGLVHWDIKPRYYPKANYHIMYYGEIVSSYLIE
ncbi:flavin reductase family protein [Proteinivorax hydrogeniformans]|uniref:Flavin reductase family protein n=1 Tax=Proteinivorax hydrogeniformans TaxID=1826727 RepID=A0AAU8HRH1_9FIRM